MNIRFLGFRLCAKRSPIDHPGGAPRHRGLGVILLNKLGDRLQKVIGLGTA